MQRRLYWHGFFFLLFSLLLGFPTSIAPHAEKWRVAHVATMVTSVILIGVASAWDKLQHTERAEKLVFRLLLVGSYVGSVLNIYVALVNLPLPVSNPGVNPDVVQAVILGTGLGIVVVSLIWACVLLMRGMRGT
jgi:hypothetical protein